jgi:hypothetical protein
MTRQSTIERAARLEGKPGLVCIGRFLVDGEAVDFPYSEDDLVRDAGYWGGLLSRYGIARGGRVVVSALAWELPWALAVRVGVNRAGGSYSNAELWGWDARRLDMFVRRLSPHAVIGPGRELIESLGNIVDLEERLGHVPVLLVRPDAVPSVEDAGVRPTGVIAPLGPTVAVSLPDGSGLAVDEDEWSVDEQDGELLITTAGPRAATFHRQRTGVRGHVDRTSAGTRIHLEDD